jgi:hypothetical protein
MWLLPAVQLAGSTTALARAEAGLVLQMALLLLLICRSS